MKFIALFNAHQFCFVFSLQSGTVMSLMVFFAITLTSIINTIYFLVVTESFIIFIVPVLISYFYLIVFATGLILAFIGAYRESPSWMLLSSIFIGVAIIFFIIIGIMSLFPEMFRYVCYGTRCPDQLWLQKSYWREQIYYEMHNRSSTNFSVTNRNIPAMKKLRKQDRPLELTVLKINTPLVLTYMQPEKTFQERSLTFKELSYHRIWKPKRHAPNSSQSFNSQRGKHFKKSTDDEKNDKAENSKEGEIEGTKEILEDDNGINEQVDESDSQDYEDETKVGAHSGNTIGSKPSSKYGLLYHFSFAMSIVYLIVYVGAIIYTLFGFLSFAHELERDLIEII